jgi:hypothetical protein
MSFLKKLFGIGKSDEADNKNAPSIEYEGFLVRSTPQNEGGQFRLCGIISKEIDGELREYQLIRADILPSADEAHETCFRKARRVIDEQGDRLLE